MSPVSLPSSREDRMERQYPLGSLLASYKRQKDRGTQSRGRGVPHQRETASSGHSTCQSPQVGVCQGSTRCFILQPKPKGATGPSPAPDASLPQGLLWVHQPRGPARRHFREPDITVHCQSKGEFYLKKIFFLLEIWLPTVLALTSRTRSSISSGVQFSVSKYPHPLSLSSMAADNY